MKNLLVMWSALFIILGAVQPSGTSRIHGQVTNLLGERLPEVRVDARKASGETFSTTTNADGLYSFDSLGSDQYDLSFSSDGFARQDVSLRLGRGVTQRVDMGLPLYILHGTEHVIHGAVVDSEGRPLPSVDIVAFPAFNRRLETRTTTSDAGEFELVFGEGAQYVVLAYKEGYRVSSKAIVLWGKFGGPTIELTFQLERL